MKYYKAIILPMGQRIVSVVDTKHNQSYALPNWENRSADFNWGYGGTGVSDLARSLLKDLDPDIDFEDPDDSRAFFLKDNLLSGISQDKGWNFSAAEIEGATQLADREPYYD
jgi:hypothetical protein